MHLTSMPGDMMLRQPNTESPLRKLSRGQHIAALSMFLALAACGGGGGDSGTSNASLNTAPAQPAAQQSETYVAILSGVEQVPPRTTGAQGHGSVVVNVATGQMAATVTTAGMAATAVNLHQGAAGATGPVVFSLVETAVGSGVWTGRTILSSAEYAALRAGQFYFNVPSASHAAGEIRGQLVFQSGTAGSGSAGPGATPAGTSTGGTTGASGSTPLR